MLCTRGRYGRRQPGWVYTRAEIPALPAGCPDWLGEVVLGLLRSDHCEEERRLTPVEGVAMLEVAGLARQWEAREAAEEAGRVAEQSRRRAERRAASAEAAQQQAVERLDAALAEGQRAEVAQRQATHALEAARAEAESSEAAAAVTLRKIQQERKRRTEVEELNAQLHADLEAERAARVSEREHGAAERAESERKLRLVRQTERKLQAQVASLEERLRADEATAAARLRDAVREPKPEPEPEPLLQIVESAIQWQSAIVESDELAQLKAWLPSNTSDLELIYRASEHGWKAEDFHRMCDDQGATLIVVKDVQGYVFGGYTATPWSIDGNSYPSPCGFMYSLRSHAGAGPTLLPLKDPDESHLGKNAVFHHRNFGPTFGSCDLVIKSYASTNSAGIPSGAKSYTSLGEYYACPVGQDGQTFLTGARHFQAAEVEAFHVRGPGVDAMVAVAKLAMGAAQRLRTEERHRDEDVERCWEEQDTGHCDDDPFSNSY